MESEMNRKNDILHPLYQNVLKEMKVLLFIKGVMN